MNTLKEIYSKFKTCGVFESVNTSISQAHQDDLKSQADEIVSDVEILKMKIIDLILNIEKTDTWIYVGKLGDGVTEILDYPREYPRAQLCRTRNLFYEFKVDAHTLHYDLPREYYKECELMFQCPGTYDTVKLQDVLAVGDENNTKLIYDVLNQLWKKLSENPYYLEKA